VHVIQDKNIYYIEIDSVELIDGIHPSEAGAIHVEKELVRTINGEMKIK